MDSQDPVCEALSRMTDRIHQAGMDMKSYIFGSYVNNKGVQFDEQTGDIDLAHVLPQNFDCLSRSRIIFSLRAIFDDLEIDLMRSLQRDNVGSAIASHCVLTPLEQGFDIHKDQKKDLLSGERFVLLPNSNLRASPLVAIAPARDPIWVEENFEIIQTIAFAQSTRNRFLSAAANGKRAMAPIPPNASKDPLPKECMRIAAMLAWAKSGRGNIADRENTQKGLDLITNEILPRYSKGSLDYQELSEVLSVRRGARGRAQDLKAEHQVLIAEMLYDYAADDIEPSFRMKLREFINDLNGMMQKPFDPAT